MQRARWCVGTPQTYAAIGRMFTRQWALKSKRTPYGFKSSRRGDALRPLLNDPA